MFSHARKWFEDIAQLRQHVTELENEIDAAYASAGMRSQRTGSTAGSAQHNALESIDYLVDRGTARECEEAKALLARRLERATDVLYGRSGRGGLAMARSYMDADILCCHYLQGMGWAQIADQVVRPKSECPRKWVQARAKRALAYIDRVGMETLANM